MKNYKSIICTLAAVCLLGTAAFCGYQIYDRHAHEAEQTEALAEIAEVVEQAQADESGEAPEIPLTEEETVLPEYGELFLQNPDMVGWISIAGTNVNYPVMQTKDEPNFYQRLANEIFFRIYNGIYQLGTKLPSYLNIAKEAGSSPETVRKAIRELQEHGVIEKTRYGNFVTSDQEKVFEYRDNYLAVVEHLMDFNQAFHAYDTVEGANCLTAFRVKMTQREAAVQAVEQIGLNQLREVDSAVFARMPQFEPMFRRRLELLRSAARR